MMCEGIACVNFSVQYLHYKASEQLMASLYQKYDKLCRVEVCGCTAARLHASHSVMITL